MTHGETFKAIMFFGSFDIKLRGGNDTVVRLFKGNKCIGKANCQDRFNQKRAIKKFSDSIQGENGKFKIEITHKSNIINE